MDTKINGETGKKRKRSLIIDVIKDFNSNTTLHGFKYFTDENVSMVEKIFWVFTFILSLVLCCILIHNVWDKWQTSPVIVSFSEKMVPVWKIPFPSVTICPQMKSRASVFNYSMYFNKFKDGSLQNEENASKILEKLDDVALVCGRDSSVRFTDRDICDKITLKHINEVTPDVPDILHSCVWRGVIKNCSEIFTRVLSARGVCYNFNGLAAEEMLRAENIQKDFKYVYKTNRTRGWSLENGYTTKQGRGLYPHRGRENGAIADLDIILKENKIDEEDECNGKYNGFMVFLHHPMDVPRSKIFYNTVHRGQLTSLAVKAHMTSTSENLKNYPPHVRQCYFPSDLKLRYYQKYTQSNCETECRSNYTFAKCGCVWYNLAHNNSDQICCFNKRKCVSQAKEELADYEMNLALQAAAGNRTNLGCRCLPACDYVHYEAEFTQSTYGKVFDTADATTYSFSRLLVYFKDAQYPSVTRSELFGLTDFLANCGGLLGLFLGFSFLSLVEIIYYSSLRLCCIIRREGMTYNVTKKNETKGELNIIKLK